MISDIPVIQAFFSSKLLFLNKFIEFLTNSCLFDFIALYWCAAEGHAGFFRPGLR